MKSNQKSNSKSNSKGNSRKKTIKKSPNLFFDSKESVFFKRNSNNIIFQVTSSQLPVLKKIGLDNIFLSKDHILEPHWHPNAAELDYVVAGEAVISVLNPLTPQLLTYHVKRGDVVFIPINWWHWIIAITDEAHIVAVYDNEKRQNIFGSDMLRKTPPEIFQLAYGVNAKELAKVLAPITQTVVIGPKNASRLNDMFSEMFTENNRMREGMWWGSARPPELFFDVSDNIAFQRNPENVLYEVTSAQIPEMQDLSIGDLFLSKDHIREPHWHPNADELDFIISGEVIISILNPSTLKLQTYHVKPGQVTFLPKGWWHWITCVTEEAHLLVNFNDGTIQSVEGSDVLRFTPPDVFQLAYDVNARKLNRILSPIDQTVVIGPPQSDFRERR
jgi:oxalate decarboxylase/phosphoglucose isomerase-like protein (cupin superfamily)